MVVPSSLAGSSVHRSPPPVRLTSRETPSRSQSPPFKGHSIQHRLYNLPPALETSAFVNQQRRARPGGLAGIASESDSRSIYSEHSTSIDRHAQGINGRRRSHDKPAPPVSRRQNSDINRYNAYMESNALGPTHDELSLFAHHCRVFYMAANPPQESASYISSTLASFSPQHRPLYTKLQSTLRSLAHFHYLRVRITSFHALISSTYASGSLTPASRSFLTGLSARIERRERLARFVRTWCAGSGAGGVEPFFRGLWAVLRAQSRGGKRRGGAGARRVVWEVDDAVFLESGGLEFLHEAVILLKGVLGFTDQPLSSPPKLKRIRTIPKSFAEARAGTPPLSPQRPSISPSPIETEGSETRTRAFSDPFQDISPLSGIASNRNTRYPPNEAGQIGSPLLSEHRDLNTVTDADERELLLDHYSGAIDDDLDSDDIEDEELELNKPRFRLWTFPSHISDEEAEDLISQFPATILNRKDVRFPYTPPGHGADSDRWPVHTIDTVTVRVPYKTEEIERTEGVLRHGTGRMWVGIENREGRWQGGRWYRFKRWWRRLFGMA